MNLIYSRFILIIYLKLTYYENNKILDMIKLDNINIIKQNNDVKYKYDNISQS